MIEPKDPPEGQAANGLEDRNQSKLVHPSTPSEECDDDSIHGMHQIVGYEIDQAMAKKVLLLWMFRAHRAASAHYDQAIKYRDRNTYLIVFNAIYSIGLLFWVTWLSGRTPNLNIGGWKLEGNLITGVVSVLLVVLGVLQFILRYSERQGAHREAGQEFSNLQRKIERYSLYVRHNMGQIHNISREYNHITRSYPLVSRSTWLNGRRKKLIHQIERLEDELRNVPCADIEE